MKLKLSLKQIKKELKPLNRYEVVLYGSYVDGNFNKRSDIDVALITRIKDYDKDIEIWNNALKKLKPIYHLNIFELLPLQVKANIIDSYKIVYGNNLEISEYFYHFRKLWKDSKYRYYTNQFMHYKEKIRKIKAA